MSIVANITEASGKRTVGSRRSFYDHAKGSTYEVIGILTLAQKRGLISDETYRTFYRDGDEIATMLWGLMNAEQRIEKNREKKG